MNYFIEGIQGSGKSTLVEKLYKKYPNHKVYHEGDYSPTELAWCAYVSKDRYTQILEKYSDVRNLIEEKSFEENGQMVICYTQIITDIPGFHKDLEQYEIYNGRKSEEEFQKIILDRYRLWHGEDSIFECSIFQNIVEDMILFQVKEDSEIINFYKDIEKALSENEYQIIYLSSDDIASNIDVIRKERSDENGNELWYPLMMKYFDESPYAKKYGVSGGTALIKHLEHRQELELKICREVFEGRYTVLKSKGEE